MAIDNENKSLKKKAAKSKKGSKGKSSLRSPKKGENKARRVTAQDRRKRLIRRFLIALAVVLLILLGFFLFSRYHTYGDYKVISTSELEDTVSTKYLELDGKLFKYSGSGAGVENYEGDVLWTSAYDMSNPIADQCDGTYAVADQGGTEIEIYNEDGPVGSVETSLSIVKIKVAKQGVVAAILDGGNDTWINFYASDGSLIAENQTRVDDPGYPLDIDVSEDGVLIMVAYQFVSGEETTSYIVFYNFATAGQNEIDNIVSGFMYQGNVAPEVEFLDASTSVAFRDDGFSIYKGKQIPKESANVIVDKEVVSTFYDEDNIGLVFRNDSQDKQYTMNVYNTDGELKFEKDFNIDYSSIRMSEGQIVMHNSNQVCVVNTNGVEKFNGNIDEGNINDFFRLGWNKYVLVLENGLDTIKFK